MFVPLTYRPGDLAEVDFFSVVGAKTFVKRPRRHAGTCI